MILAIRTCGEGRLTAWAGQRLRAFGRDEDGSMVIFAMFLILMMLMVGGMAVDLMRFETDRSAMYSTIDRAALAAADLDQQQNPVIVVEDWVAKAGLADELVGVEVIETINSRSVEVDAEYSVNTMFMDLLGMDTLEATGSSRAIESISDIEIVLVLDVSGSMNDNSRIVNLRAAAREFVRSVLANDEENRVSIAIVPFNAQVNLGATLMARYNVTNLHGRLNSNCIDVPSSHFATVGVSNALAMPQAGYFDGYSTTTNTGSWVAPAAPSFSSIACRLQTQNIVRLPNRNIATLESQIQGLTADGRTSITLGMKWGMALIDPGSRAMFNTLISGGHMAANLAGRPYDYARDNTLKVIILMTDGEHVESLMLDQYRTGASPIFRATGDTNYSAFHAFRVVSTNATTICDSRPFWVPHLSAWHSRPWNGTVPSTSACYVVGALTTGVTNQTWQALWAAQRVQWVAWQLYARAIGTTTATRNTAFTLWYANFTTMTVVADMDTTLQQSCTLAETNGVIVFGIAFEAPDNGQTQIFNCSTSPSHYFNASGMDITNAFRAIASQINALRLVQ